MCAMSSYRRRKRPAENELSELEKLIAETEEQYEVYVPLDKRKELEAEKRALELAREEMRIRNLAENKARDLANTHCKDDTMANTHWEVIDDDVEEFFSPESKAAVSALTASAKVLGQNGIHTSTEKILGPKIPPLNLQGNGGGSRGL